VHLFSAEGIEVSPLSREHAVLRTISLQKHKGEKGPNQHISAESRAHLRKSVQERPDDGEPPTTPDLILHSLNEVSVAF
tara:strand:- start:241 stop:477 length:237 start_codon:yes stop_codon:yes gene_type:complete